LGIKQAQLKLAGIDFLDETAIFGIRLFYKLLRKSLHTKHSFHSFSFRIVQFIVTSVEKLQVFYNEKQKNESHCIYILSKFYCHTKLYFESWIVPFENLKEVKVETIILYVLLNN
jgi:hypothetical protein